MMHCLQQTAYGVVFLSDLMVQVELAEAELNYINCQTDNLLSYIDRSNIDRQPLLYDVKKNLKPDEIELQLNVTNKNYLNRCRSDRNLLEDDVTIIEREKLSLADGNSRPINRDAKQDIRKATAGCSSIDCKRPIMPRDANETGSQQPEDPHKCSSCAATTFKWAAGTPTKTTGQCTYCNAADCPVRNNLTTRLNSNDTAQHNAATCNWKRVRSTGRNTRLPGHQCPLCAFQRQRPMSQSISDLSGAETQFLRLLSHRSQPDISNILDNGAIHCGSKGCSYLQGRPRHPHRKKPPLDVNRRRRTSCAERSLSSSYSTLLSPTRLAA